MGGEVLGDEVRAGRGEDVPREVLVAVSRVRLAFWISPGVCSDRE
jgi:hypothetical protein